MIPAESVYRELVRNSGSLLWLRLGRDGVILELSRYAALFLGEPGEDLLLSEFLPNESSRQTLDELLSGRIQHAELHLYQPLGLAETFTFHVIIPL
ncbi:MAG: hypothetical protein HQL31_06970 [Planctomycetes bacterium]|nr:hypothetical protein [Planctomycetota bacterium]